MREAVDKILTQDSLDQNSTEKGETARSTTSSPSSEQPKDKATVEALIKSERRRKQKEDKRKAKQSGLTNSLLRQVGLTALGIWMTPLVLSFLFWGVFTPGEGGRHIVSQPWLIAVAAIWTLGVASAAGAWLRFRWALLERRARRKQVEASATDKIRRKAAELPPQLLKNIAVKDLPLLNARLREILTKRESVRLEHCLRFPTRLVLIGIIASLLYHLYYPLSEYTDDAATSYVLIGGFVLVGLIALRAASSLLCLLASRSSDTGISKALCYITERSAAEVWTNLPSPPTSPDPAQLKKQMKRKAKEAQGLNGGSDCDGVNEGEKLTELEGMLGNFSDEAFKERLRNVAKGEAKMEKEDTKTLFSRVREKEEKQKWAALLFGEHNAVAKTPSTKGGGEVQRTKAERLQKIIKDKENSTLNKERGLDHIRAMRVFLQSPTDVREDPKRHCLRYALSTIDTIEELSQIWTNKEGAQDPCLALALNYNIGLYSLYGAQVKWFFPKLVGTEHIEIRDNVMHGVGHSYTQHLTAEGVRFIFAQLGYLLALKPKLAEALLEDSK